MSERVGGTAMIPQRELDKLRERVDDIEALQLCDCCYGLFDEVFDVGGHQQCKTCTSLANASAEIEQAQSEVKTWKRVICQLVIRCSENGIDITDILGADDDGNIRPVQTKGGSNA